MTRRRKKGGGGAKAAVAGKVSSAKARPPARRTGGGGKGARGAKSPPSLERIVARNFKRDGMSCAESMLFSGLEFLDEPRELLAIGTPFAGGMHMGAHCGLYTAGLMLIGLACSGLPDGKAVAGELRRSFTEAWERSWPLLCRQIGTAKVPGGCKSIGKTAGKRLERLLRSLVRHPGRVRFSKRQPAKE